jgi:ankyrin repeat protein
MKKADNFAVHHKELLGACVKGSVNDCKFYFAEELFGKSAIIEALDLFFHAHYFLNQLIYSFIECKHLDVNFQNECGYTPLSLAATHCQIGVLETLLQIPSIDVNLADESGAT